VDIEATGECINYSIYIIGIHDPTVTMNGNGQQWNNEDIYIHIYIHTYIHTYTSPTSSWEFSQPHAEENTPMDGGDHGDIQKW
jgi:hypothetical protein